MGIDYGTVRVGVALSDEEGILAFPFAILENSKDLVSEIEDICKENNVKEIVVGESRDFNQKENAIMEDIKIFVEKLKLPVHMHPEFLTSIEAERIQGKVNKLDASAAAIILQNYLDTHGKHR
jgi:putative Holliday junction resolvase